MPLAVRAAPVLLACLALAASCGSDHHHPEATQAAPDDDIAPVTLTVFGRHVLLFLEHPQLVRGEPARFLAHFSVLADGAPVRSGQVRLEIGARALVADAPRSDGLFVPEGSLADAGEFPASIVLEGDGVSERLDLGTFTVHADMAAARAAAQALAAPPGDGVAFLMEQQWQARVLFAQAAPARLVRRLAVPARTLLAEGASAVASAPVPGRLVAAPQAALPRSGERVEAGQVLALVEPLLSAPEAAQWRALELEQARQVIEVERALAEAEARLQFAEREHERLGRLREGGLGTQAQLELAIQDLAIARGAVEAARGARAALAASPMRLAEGGGAAGGAPRVPVVAPLAGRITEAPRVLGEALAAGEPLFRIVDTSRLWVEGRISEFDLPRLAGVSAAVVSLAAQPQRRIAVGAPHGPPAYVAPEVDPASRSVALRFELPNADGSLRAGQLAELLLDLGEVDAAVTVPEEAVVLDSGQPTAWVVHSGELFVRRSLRLGVRDGGRVEVLEGLQAGERVATRGADTIRLAALSPASFGAGHAH